MKSATRVLVLFGTAATLGACSLSEEDFQQQYADAYCSLIMDCDSDMKKFFGDEDGCIAAMDLAFNQIPGEDEGCTFNATNAKACLEFVEAAECSDVETLASGAAACETVYEGDGCDTSATDTGA